MDNHPFEDAMKHQAFQLVELQRIADAIEYLGVVEFARLQVAGSRPIAEGIYREALKKGMMRVRDPEDLQEEMVKSVLKDVPAPPFEKGGDDA